MSGAVLAVKTLWDGTAAARGMQQVETRAGRMSNALNRGSKLAAGGLALVGAAALTMAKNAGDDAAAQAQLALAMKNVGQGSKAQVSQMESYVSAMSAAVGVSDDELRPSLAALVRATGSASTAQAELKRALDVSAATGKPVEQVANAIAKAHSGQTSALSRLVPGISQAAIKSKDMNKIMGELARTTGGAAATAANTAAGKIRRMQISFDEAKESLGAFLIPALGILAGLLAQVGTFAQNNSRTVAILAGVVAALAVSVIAINLAFKVYTAYTRAAAAAQWLLNTAMFSNPIGIVVLAIIALGAGFVVAYKKSATFRAIVQGAGRGAAAALGWVVDKAHAVASWFGKLGPAATKAKDIAVKAFQLYTKPIQVVIDIIKKLVGWISKIKFPKVPKAITSLGGLLGGGDDAPPRRPPPGGGVPGHGRGGPGGGGGFWMTLGGGGGAAVVNKFYITGAVDPVSVARQIKDILDGQDNRTGNR